MNLPLFDFDGTITTRETFPAFIRFAASPLRVAMGAAVLAPILVGYRLGWVPVRIVRALIVRVAFSGGAEAKLSQAGERFAREVLPGLLRPQALERIGWHREQGDEIVVVSGGLALYLEPWAHQHGLKLICSELAVNDGKLSGRYQGADCVAKEKSRRIRERFQFDQYDAVYAYGDTHEDLDMLALADRKWFRWEEWHADPAAAE